MRQGYNNLSVRRWRVEAPSANASLATLLGRELMPASRAMIQRTRAMVVLLAMMGSCVISGVCGAIVPMAFAAPEPTLPRLPAFF